MRRKLEHLNEGSEFALLEESIAGFVDGGIHCRIRQWGNPLQDSSIEADVESAVCFCSDSSFLGSSIPRLTMDVKRWEGKFDRCKI